MSRGLLLSSLALGVALAALFAAYPLLDLEVADWFFDHQAGKFPFSIDYSLNLVRRVANWVPFLLLLPPVFAVLRKLVFPNAPMAVAPSIVLFLIGSFLVGPGSKWKARLSPENRASCSKLSRGSIRASRRSN